MIPAHELAAMQAACAAALDTPCTIERKAPVADGYGSESDGYQPLATPLCSLSQPSAQLMQNYEYLIGDQSTWVVGLPAGQDVKNDDQIVVAGQTLRVQAVLAPRSYETRRRVLASEIR